MNPESIFDFSLGPSKIIEFNSGILTFIIGVIMTTRFIFNPIMLSAFHHHQIARIIIRSVSVNMVNNFTWLKWSTNHLFGYQAMLVQVVLTSLADNFVTAARNVTAFPIVMILAIVSLDRTFAYRGVLKLFKSRRTQCFMPKRLVFFGSHLVGHAKMRGTNLHSAFESA